MLGMKGLQIQQYHCTYKNPKDRAFLLLRKKPSSSVYQRKDVLYNANTLVYTVPFVNKQTLDKRNIVLGFDSIDHAEYYKSLCSFHHVSVEQFRVLDLIHYSNVISTPLAILVNSYCPIDEKNGDDSIVYDIYYKPDSNPLEIRIPDYFD